jgi:undecaprenyl-diphosphatase
MPASDLHASDAPALPALWYESAPVHFDTRIAWWMKSLVVLAAIALAILFVDQSVALWARANPIPDLAYAGLEGQIRGGDIGRELMWFEQWGQFVCSVTVILAVAFLDPRGRRRALAIAIGCLLTLALTHLFKDLCGRSRPFIADDTGAWVWGGPARGFTGGARWTSFPSAHTSGAFALSAGLAWFYPRARAFFMALALITATQRVLHAAHYVSDTIAGMGLAVMTVRFSLQKRFAGWLISWSPPDIRRWWLQDSNL